MTDFSGQTHRVYSPLARNVAHIIPPSPEPIACDEMSFQDFDECKVYDVSFGAMGDRKAPPRMLLYNPDEFAIRSCTIQSVKRHKRQTRQGKLGAQSSPSLTPSPYPTSDSLATQISRVWLEPTFSAATTPTEPMWIEFHRLVIDYELKVMQALAISDLAEADLYGTCQLKEDFASDYFEVMTKYRGLQVMSKIWHWPLCKGREMTTDDTPVPNVDKQYIFPENKDKDAYPNPLEPIYSSFLLWNDFSSPVAWGNCTPSSGDSYSGTLSVFRRLRAGGLRSLVGKSEEDSSHTCSSHASLHSSHASTLISRESPWEGLFSPREVEEWTQVVEHYSTNNCTLFEEGKKPCPVPMSPSPTGGGRRRGGQVSSRKPFEFGLRASDCTFGRGLDFI